MNDQAVKEVHPGLGVLRIVYLLVLFPAGLYSVWAGFSALQMQHDIDIHRATATGVIIAMEANAASHRAATLITSRYSVAGRIYEHKDTTYSTFPFYAVNKQVTIEYATDNPNHARLRDDYDNVGSFFILILGTCLVIPGVILLIAPWKRRSRVASQ